MSSILNEQCQLSHWHDRRRFCRDATWNILVPLLWSLALTCSCRGDVSATNHPYSGVAWYSITRAEPPTRMFVAEIDLTNPRIQIRVSPGGPDPDGDGPWQTTLMPPTRIAARERMDLVVNGDFFRARGIKDTEGTNSTYRAEAWSTVVGPAATDGRIWSSSSSSRPCLIVRQDGKVLINMLSLPAPGDWEVVSGNTMLVTNGVAVPHENKVRHPRTVVGLDAKREKLVILVVDGRRSKVAVGMNYDELAAELIRLGCNDALNLDGGGSSVMAVRDPASGTFNILNQPTDGHERAVANALGVTTH
jgi:Phosphodiester glycosidase